MTFDDRYAELMKYKEKKGHCNPTQRKSGGGEYQSLGLWCSTMRASCNKIQKEEKPHPSATGGCRFQVESHSGVKARNENPRNVKIH